MKTALTTVAAMSLALVSGLSAALADGPRPNGGNTIVQTGELHSATDRLLPHYEWQYHYIGTHGRVEGYWALVR